MSKLYTYLQVLALSVALSACGGGSSSGTDSTAVGSNTTDSTNTTISVPNVPTGTSDGSTGTSTSSTGTINTGSTMQPVVSAPPPAVTTIANNGSLKNPILFVTQVPLQTASDFGSRVATFANHQTAMSNVPRGGDLMIRYPDGSLRNLTQEAGFGTDGFQGANSIAVREPTVHWSGAKAIFSMLIGSPDTQYGDGTYRWQIYEVAGLGKGEKATITKVANQPSYNNVSPFYGSDDSVYFTSDRPRDGNVASYPQLDEYESTATVTGIWKLNTSNGNLVLMNHSPSGVFSPSVDSFGRIIFSRWDHLQRDQQADLGQFTVYNYTSDNSTTTTAVGEVFPEPRATSTTVYGTVQGYTYNLFSPWQLNQDGTGELTLNHIGRNELMPAGIPSSFIDDTNLGNFYNPGYTANQRHIRGDGGILQIKEDPANPGWYYAVAGHEFGEQSASSLLKFSGAPGMSAEKMTFSDATDPNWKDGRYRDPCPTVDGQMVASRSPNTVTVGANTETFRIEQLNYNSATGQFTAGTMLTMGITKNLSWWDNGVKMTYNGKLWELEAVEVVAKNKPALTSQETLQAPEKSILSSVGVDETALRNWMKTNNLALLIVRNLTSRDRADFQQPYNLTVPNGVTTTRNSGKVYSIGHFQIFQADLVRGYKEFAGRRPIAQPQHDGIQYNVPNTSGPAGSVKIETDGSIAAFVPANRALSWQSTDPSGNAVVRERVWVSAQPGEIKTCAACHGINNKDQSGLEGLPGNQPEALRSLLKQWVNTQK